jgi:quinol monooxygenase YgiN
MRRRIPDPEDSMVVVHVTFQVKPEARDAFLAAAKVASATTRALEPGNQSYRFSVDVDDPDTIVLVEEWVDKDALVAHTKLPHFAEFRAAIEGKFDTRVALMFDVSRQRDV